MLDALTGEPTSDVIASWAIAPDARTGDGAATALFFDTAATFYQNHDVTTVRMFADGRVDASSSFTGELFR